MQYLTGYERRVREIHQLIRAAGSSILSAEVYFAWKRDNDSALLQLKKLASHQLLTDLAIVIQRREFQMGADYYISPSVTPKAEAADTHGPQALPEEHG